jgi:ribosomal protein L11 methyltransferase
VIYRRFSFVLPRAAEESLADRLWELGTLGLELVDGADGRLRIDAWFAEQAPATVVGRADDWLPAEVELVETAAVADEDWMATYRRHARPVRLGSRLVVDPRDEATRPMEEGRSGECWLHLPARRAFGTGSHESTRLAVELLEELPLAGRTVLDLGTGTGVLAFAALAGGARWVVALDNDPLAAMIAGQNRTRNRIWPAIAAGAIDCLRPEPSFDLAVANILPEQIVGDLAGLAARLRLGGDAVFSGLLDADRQRYEARLGEVGLEMMASRRSGDWVALHARLIS